ncbi:MAG TPA: PfkB family carbohydrate kinase, partial [Planctomycetota bacterium]|nr:PfkB family carbohydrate kinase [Planctomycetota bacterium]
MNTQIFKEFPKQNILVMGDLILDHYVFGKVSRISPEAPIPIFDFEREEYRLGGASNVAGNLVSLGVKTSLMGCVGNDDCADIILQELVRHNIQTDSIFKDKERPTTIKTRYIAQGQHL